MKQSIRLATGALSNRIYAGRPNNAGDGFRGERHDVTSDVLKCVAEHIGIGRKATVHRDGEPAYVIAIIPCDSGRHAQRENSRSEVEAEGCQSGGAANRPNSSPLNPQDHQG